MVDWGAVVPVAWTTKRKKKKTTTKRKKWKKRKRKKKKKNHAWLVRQRRWKVGATLPVRSSIACLGC